MVELIFILDKMILPETETRELSWRENNKNWAPLWWDLGITALVCGTDGRTVLFGDMIYTLSSIYRSKWSCDASFILYKI